MINLPLTVEEARVLLMLIAVANDGSPIPLDLFQRLKTLIENH
jgi:hypothetical protein